MAQVSSRWQQIVNKIQKSRWVEFQRRTGQRFLGNRFQGPGGWLLLLTFVVGMLLWNWQLLLATGTGILVMLLVYLMQEWHWQIQWSSLLRFFSGANRQLTIAVGSGAIASLSSYLAICIWIDSDSPWIAAGAILQGFGTLLTLILLIWQIISRQVNRLEANFNKLLNNLTEVDPLKRLIAVRQLTALAANKRLEKLQKHTILDYFQLMLSGETEIVIRNAVLEGLEALDAPQVLNKVNIPLNLTKSAVIVPKDPDNC